jgi:nucleotide-binding universal stress UspA family protein
MRTRGGEMFPTKILLATDGSAEAERAAQMAKTVSERLAVDGPEEAKHATKAAAELSGGTGSEVPVLPAPASMYGPHFYSTGIKARLLERVNAESRAFLDKQAEAVRSSGGSSAQTYLAKGRPDVEIVKLAEEIGAGLIVLGSRGPGGIRRVLIGSVSDSVVRHAHCPIMVVRSD